VSNEIPSERVYEDDQVIAFLDIFPRAPGHTVVIPRTHAPTIIDLPVAEVGPVFQVVQKLAKAVQTAMAAPGLTIGMNQGKVSGQEVDHLHIHILPRFKDDGGGAIQSIVSNPSTDPLQEIGRKIKEQL